MVGEVVGVDVDVDLLGPGGEGGPQEVGEGGAPGEPGSGDEGVDVATGELALGQHGGVEAAGLGGHEVVGAVLEEAQERHHAGSGVGDVGDGGQAIVEVGQVGADVALDEADREVGLGPEVVEERALRAGRAGSMDHPTHTTTSAGTSAGLPQLDGLPVVTDGGLETDLIYHHGPDLPEFAAFVLVDDDRGRDLLTGYYQPYLDIARRAGAAVQLETPTWRANGDWGERLGYSPTDLDRVNRDAVALLHRLRDRAGLDRFLVSGCVGPRGDGYVAGDEVEPDEAAAYHAPQIEAFATAGADLVTALTLTGTGEAIGIVAAARAAGLPVAVSFTVEQDGRLPDGTPLAAAVTEVDAAGGPDYFMVNCAHPTHIAPALGDAAAGAWRSRIVGLRANASTLSHEELDAATELDEGDPAELATAHDGLRPQFPNLALLGGCCGTDARHVAALWGTT